MLPKMRRYQFKQILFIKIFGSEGGRGEDSRAVHEGGPAITCGAQSGESPVLSFCLMLFVSAFAAEKSGD